MIRCFILLLYAYTIVGIGYDSGGGDRTTCGRPYRAGRLYQPPCDLARMGYCNQAGQLYPWRAVKRFVKDNQGLMRRMYGDQRQGHVLKAELEDGEEFEEEWEKNEKERGGYGRWRPEPIRFARYQHHDEIDNDLDEDLDLDLDDPYAGESRYLRGDLTNEDVLNTKFVISEQEAAIAIKLAELKAAAHFRPGTHRSTFTTRKTPLSTSNPPAPTTTTTTTTTTQETHTATSKRMSASATEPKKDSTTPKTNNGVTPDIEETTTAKKSHIIVTTKTVLLDSTEGSTLTTTSSTTTDDFMDNSTIDTTTDRSTDNLANNTLKITKKPTKTILEKVASETQSTQNTTTIKPTVGEISASDRLGETIETDDSITFDSTDQNSDSDSIKVYQNDTKGSAEDLKNSDQVSDENFDQTVESSENSEVYSDSNGNLKQAETGNTPAILFQDMEEEQSKKKMPMNFNKMKGVNACPVKEEVVAPFWANNTRGEVLALLNMYPFEQYVHWEKCTFEHRQMYCREGCRCEQQYRLHRLLAYDPNNECRGIFSDWFRFPSCCVCKCYDMPPEFRVTSRSPRFQLPYPEKEEDYDV